MQQPARHARVGVRRRRSVASTRATRAQLFWLMGGGGTGKSVLTAELLYRLFHLVVPWHFCRHDDAEQSKPCALLRSLAAMLCTRLPGFEAALGDVPAAMRESTDPKEVFDAAARRAAARARAAGRRKAAPHHHRRARRDPQGGPAAASSA